jgi:hypothetical protein
VIISPSRIEDIVPTEGVQTPPAAEVDRWERDWSVGNLKLVLENRTDRLWSVAKQRAGASPQPLLTQSDPLPDMLITIPHRALNTALLVHVPLTIEQV